MGFIFYGLLDISLLIVSMLPLHKGKWKMIIGSSTLSATWLLIYNFSFSHLYSIIILTILLVSFLMYVVGVIQLLVLVEQE